MKRINEAGYTLLLTLVLIVIITGFIGTLSYVTLAHQSQVEKTDEKFLLSDITEMGIEFYRNHVVEDYVRTIYQVKNAIQEELANAPKEKYDTEAEVRALELREESSGLQTLKTTITSYNTNPIPVEEPVLHFSLSRSPYEIESINPSYIRYKFNVKGSNNDKQEDYSFTLILPKKLINVSITLPDTGSGSGPSIDFSKTIPTPNFTPLTDIGNCDGSYTNKTCISISDTIKDIDNSTVYFQGDTSTSNANNTDFNNSSLYIDGNLDAKNFNDITDVSIFVNGNTSIDQFKATGLKLYSSGTLSLNKHINIYDSNIRSLGAILATKQGMTISNTHMVLEGQVNSIDSFHVTNSSTVCVKDNSSIDELFIDSTSSVYIINTANRTGLNSNNSKLPIIVDMNTFNEKCYGVSTSNDEIGIIIDSNITVTPESILDEIEYDVPIKEESP